MQSSLFEPGVGNIKGEKLIFLDTESTDNTEDSRLTQLAYKNFNTKEIFNEYFRPPVPISISAMSVTHITNKMVSDKPVFENSKQRDRLIEILSDHILVAHNAPFDIMILRNEGVNVSTSIDTLRIARHLIESESYKLQYLRYLLDIDIKATAHDALCDVYVLEQLFYHLEDLMKLKYGINSRPEIIEKMKELSIQPVLMPVFNFGKYRGRTFEEVARIDRRYLEWLYSTEASKSEHEQSEDLLFTIQENLKIN
jgi:exodeoxyribonuclease X